jgi:SAM-dependent methyltransferase
MIDPNIFKASREAARTKLPQENAQESFGYFIDIANQWETYRSPEEMVNYMGIHKTHEAQFPEIAMDLGPFSAKEKEWARRYLEFFNRLACIITTTDYRPEFQFDLAETAFDWRIIRKFVDLPARILDYGAGSGRQCVSAFLYNANSIYTAVDSTLAAYTLQNLNFSVMDSMLPQASFVDLLDFETAGMPFPDISKAQPGTRVHVPAWFEADPLPERFFDVVLACHVHNELSGSDFRRLINAVLKSMADDGIFYVRSELGVPFPKNYFDVLDMHAIDIVKLLYEHDIVPVYCKYECAFQTTVFARKGSTHHKRAIELEGRETDFLDLKNSLDMTVRAGRHFTIRNIEWIVRERKKTLLLGRGHDIYMKLVEPRSDAITEKLVISQEEAMAPTDATRARIKEFQPNVIVAVGDDFFGMSRMAQEASGIDYAITVHHVMPTCFTFHDLQKQPAPFLSGKEVRYIGDIEKAYGETPHVGEDFFGS